MEILANKLYEGGKIQDKCEKAGFYKRLTLLEQQFKGAAVLLHKMGYLPVGFRNLWSNERLLNVVEQMIGPNIAGEILRGRLIIISLSFLHQVTQCGTCVPRPLTTNRPQFPGIRTMLTWTLILCIL